MDKVREWINSIEDVPRLRGLILAMCDVVDRSKEFLKMHQYLQEEYSSGSYGEVEDNLIDAITALDQKVKEVLE